MTDPSAHLYFYPNKMGRILLLSLEEVISKTGVNAVLKQSNLRHLINNYPQNNLDLKFSFEDISHMLAALEDLYGPHGGRGLALRSGRAGFKYGLREFGSLPGNSDLAFRLLPLEMKMRSGAEIFTGIFNKFSDQRVRVEERAEHFFWHIERCPFCWQRKTDMPACHLVVGLIQEALYWVSGGKYFNVEEIECIAQGARNCTILVDKKPLD